MVTFCISSSFGVGNINLSGRFSVSAFKISFCNLFSFRDLVVGGVDGFDSCPSRFSVCFSSIGGSGWNGVSIWLIEDSDFDKCSSWLTDRSKLLRLISPDMDKEESSFISLISWFTLSIFSSKSVKLGQGNFFGLVEIGVLVFCTFRQSYFILHGAQ